MLQCHGHRLAMVLLLPLCNPILAERPAELEESMKVDESMKVNISKHVEADEQRGGLGPKPKSSQKKQTPEGCGGSLQCYRVEAVKKEGDDKKYWHYDCLPRDTVALYPASKDDLSGKQSCPSSSTSYCLSLETTGYCDIVKCMSSDLKQYKT